MCISCFFSHCLWIYLYCRNTRLCIKGSPQRVKYFSCQHRQEMLEWYVMSVCLLRSPERNYHYELCPNTAACYIHCRCSFLWLGSRQTHRWAVRLAEMQRDGQTECMRHLQTDRPRQINRRQAGRFISREEDKYWQRYKQKCGQKHSKLDRQAWQTRRMVGQRYSDV